MREKSWGCAFRIGEHFYWATLSRWDIGLTARNEHIRIAASGRGRVWEPVPARWAGLSNPLGAPADDPRQSARLSRIKKEHDSGNFAVGFNPDTGQKRGAQYRTLPIITVRLPPEWGRGCASVSAMPSDSLKYECIVLSGRPGMDFQKTCDQRSDSKH